MNNWKSILPNIGLLILCQLILLVLVSKGREHSIGLYTQERLLNQEKELQFVVKSFARKAEIVVNEVFLKDDTVSLFAEARKNPESRDEMRKRLYQRLLPSYERLFSLGFRQVHFHFSDGFSFLRFHLPEQFGDSLFPFRQSVRLANTEQRYVEGFEVGRNYHAFRYVFPIQENGVHLGTVEASVPFYSIESLLQDIFNVEYYLLLKKEALDKNLLSENFTRYTTSTLLQDYFHETDDLVQHELSHKGHLEESQILQINKRITGRIEEKVEAEQFFSEAVYLFGSNYLVTFLPLKGTENETVGYFVNYAQDAVLQAIRQKMNSVHLVLGLFFCLFFYGYYIASRRKSEEVRFQQQILDTMPSPVWFRTPEGILSGWNIAFRDMFDLPGDAKDNIRIEEIWGEHSRVVHRMEEEVLRTREGVKEEIVCQCADGRDHTLIVQKAPLLDSGGRIVTLIGSAFDISERKKAEEQLLESHEELDQIFNTAANGMRIVDADHVTQRANKAFCDMVGLPPEEVIGQSCYEILPGPNCRTGECPLVRLASGEKAFKTEMHKKLDSGRELELIVSAAPLYDTKGMFAGLVEDFQDVTSFRRMEQKLRDIAITDEMTGVCNRRGFLLFSDRKLAAVQRSDQNAFVTYVDLDDLKDINDLHGHEAGDTAIRLVGACLQEMFRKPDVVARLGGDEFAVFTCCKKETSSKEAISKRLTLALEAINRTKGLPFEVAVSFGIARMKDGDTLEQLMNRADERMYQLKRTKKNSA